MKTLLRSMAGTAAFGTVLAGTALVAPVSTAIAPMDCKAQYQHAWVTHTDLTLKQRTGEFGTRNVAEVLVTSGVGTPTGQVRITTSKRSWTVSLDANGYAHHRMSRWLPPGDYTVQAQYLPGCSNFGRSHSPQDGYTVDKAHTQVTNLNARNISRGSRPAVGVDVGSSTGVTPPGWVRVKLFHHSHVRRTRTVRLRDGHAFLRFGKVWARRSWHVTATYVGTHRFRPSENDTSFWVRRAG